MFLSCLEVLQTCEKYAKTGQTDYSLHTVGLWDYARKKVMHSFVSQPNIGGQMPSEKNVSLLNVKEICQFGNIDFQSYRSILNVIFVSRL